MKKRLFPCCFLFSFGCLFTATKTNPSRVQQPRNLSTLWVSDFTLALFWNPPPHASADCSYNVARISSTSNNSSTSTERLNLPNPPWKFKGVIEGGNVLWSVTTVCGGVQSKPAVLNVTYPEVVKNLRCILYSPHKARCQWTPNRRLSDLQFFYKLIHECIGHSLPPTVKECSNYTYADGVRSGCDLEGSRCQKIHGMVNGTLENEPVRKTFKKNLVDDVEPPPLNWSVKMIENEFQINWTPPDIIISDGWKFELNFTECGGRYKNIIIPNESPYMLARASHCQYSIAIRAISENGATPWSDFMQFERDTNVLVYAIIIVPFVIAVLAALVCVAFQRYKEKIFPKIPVPRNLLFNVFDIQTSKACDSYVPEKEESCKVTLLVDSQVSKPN